MTLRKGRNLAPTQILPLMFAPDEFVFHDADGARGWAHFRGHPAGGRFSLLGDRKTVGNERDLEGHRLVAASWRAIDHCTKG